MLNPAPAQALAVQTSSSDLALCLVVNICVVLGKIISSHNVLLFPFIFTHSVTINPGYRYYSQLQITNRTLDIPDVHILEDPLIYVNIRNSVKV